MTSSYTAPHWHSAADAPQNRRVADRHIHAEPAMIATEWGEIVGTLVDVSSTGVKVRVINGLVPFEGDEVTLRLVGAGQYAARIAWVSDEAIGIVLDQAIGNVEELLWLEQRGPEWYGRAASTRRSTSVWG